MHAFSLLLAMTVLNGGAGEIAVPLEVHQALRVGVDGVASTDVPATVGLPFPEGAVEEADGRPALAVRGSDLYQFRTLRTHADGSVAWALADFRAALGPGGASSAYSVVAGTGRSEGDDLAVERADTIEIDTGPLRAVVRKTGFNLLDRVTVNGTAIIEPGRSAGLLCYGPDGAEFSAANDPEATVTIEENGPARAVIRAEGAHRDADGNRHFGWTVRMHFYRNSPEVRLFHTLRNGSREQIEHAKTTGAEISLGLGTGEPVKATVATPDGTVSVDAPVVALQGDNGFPKHRAGSLTAEQKGGAVGFSVTSGDRAVVEPGDADSLGPDLFWLDAAGPDGAGVAAGIRFAMGWFPKSLAAEPDSLRIGPWPKDNPPGYYFRFGSHATTEVLLVFHDQPLTDMAERMNRFQYRPIAKAPVEHYNRADVFPLRLDRWVTYADELRTYEEHDLFVEHNYDTRRRMTDRIRPQFRIWRYHYWGAGGGLNQHDFARIALINGLRRRGAPQVSGQMYLEGEQRFHYNADFSVQHYDDFSAANVCTNRYSWRHHRDDSIHLCQMERAPITTSKVVFEDEHPHWRGLVLHYYKTGDERIREAIEDWADFRKDNPRNSVPTYTRYFGWGMRTLVEMAQFLDDPEFQELADKGRDNLLEARELVDGKLVVGHEWDRGFTLIQRTTPERATCKPFMDGHIVWDNLYYYLLHHPDGHDGRYWLSENPRIEQLGDLLMNTIEFFYHEAWFTESDPPATGPNSYGLPYTFPLYQKNELRPPTWRGYNDRPVWNLWAVAYRWTGEERFFQRGVQSLAKVARCVGGTYWTQDCPGGLRLLWMVNNPKADTTPPEAVADLEATALGDGRVRLTWTAPDRAAAYQIKYGDRRFVDYLGYDKFTMEFEHDPDRFMTWAAGNNVSDEPTPEPGRQQSYEFTGLEPGSTVYVGIRSWDDADNRSPISNVVEVRVR